MKYYIELKECPVTCAGCQFFSERNICGGGDDYISFVCMGDEKVKKLRASDHKPKQCPIKEKKE